MKDLSLVELMKIRSDEKPSFDEFCFRIVNEAQNMSDDPNTQVGTVITKDKKIISVSWNTFCGPIHELINCNVDKFERPEKYHWFEHGERNGIFNCAKLGISLEGSVIYQNGLACTDCARAIVLSGIKKVMINKDVLDKKTWKSPHYTQDVMERSLVIFEEYEVEVKYWSKNEQRN